MPTLSSNTLVLFFATVLLGGCTDSGSPTKMVDGNQPAPGEATATTRATRVDSLNGIPGHHFGEPLAAFPGLVLISTSGFGARSYHYVHQGETGWFGQCAKAHSTDFYTLYTFAAGKFVSFSASGRGNMSQALQQQAEYLYGPGAPTTHGFRWAGSRAQAWTALDNQGPSPVNTLLVQSKAFVSQQAQAQADQLKRKNAP